MRPAFALAERVSFTERTWVEIGVAPLRWDNVTVAAHTSRDVLKRSRGTAKHTKHTKMEQEPQWTGRASVQ
jgi:hypothetical protein